MISGPAMLTALTTEGNGMDLWLLKPGHKIRTRDGAEAEVLSETEDGEWIRLRYLDNSDPLFGGTEDLAHGNEVEALLGMTPTVHGARRYRSYCTAYRRARSPRGATRQ